MCYNYNAKKEGICKMNSLKIIGLTVLRYFSLVVLVSATIFGFWNGFVAYYWESCPYIEIENICPCVAFGLFLLYIFINPPKSHS